MLLFCFPIFFFFFSKHKEIKKKIAMNTLKTLVFKMLQPIKISLREKKLHKRLKKLRNSLCLVLYSTIDAISVQVTDLVKPISRSSFFISPSLVHKFFFIAFVLHTGNRVNCLATYFKNLSLRPWVAFLTSLNTNGEKV